MRLLRLTTRLCLILILGCSLETHDSLGLPESQGSGAEKTASARTPEDALRRFQDAIEKRDLASLPDLFTGERRR